MADLRETTFKNLVVAVLIDGEIDANEKRWIDQTRRRLQIDADAANAWVQEVRANDLKITIASDAAEREKCFALMIRACAADGVVSKKERSMLEKLAPRFGADPARLEQRIRAAVTPPGVLEAVASAAQPGGGTGAGAARILELGEAAVPAAIALFRSPAVECGTANLGVLAVALARFARSGNLEAAAFLKDVAAGKIPVGGPFAETARAIAAGLSSGRSAGGAARPRKKRGRAPRT